MHKIIRLTLILSGIISVSQGQVKLGAQIGFQSASVLERNSIPGWDSTTKKYYGSKTGLNLGILVELPLTKHFVLQPGLNYSSKGRKYLKSYDSLGRAQTDSVYSKTSLDLGYMEIPIYLTYKIPLSGNQKNSFFVGAGPYFAFILSSKMNTQSLMQLNDTTPKYVNETDDLLEGNAPNKYKTFDFGINAKAGFEFGNVTLSAFYSRGFSNFYTAPYKGTFNHQLIGATLGIWLARTGAPAPKVEAVVDTDKDGIPDNQDMCPLQQGTEKYHGCPVPDTDKDGIDDEHDACKTIAGIAKYHGCPVPDTDKDGIDDEHDACPTVPGLAKYNGCPIPDTDHDGINNEEDQCPDIPGTIHNHGCPDIKQEIQEKVNIVSHSILFATKSNVLSPLSFTALDELANIMKTHPDVHLTVEGHTDNIGTAPHNLELSKKRAEAVMVYLVQVGITANRITTTGMGMDHPIADNSTEAGRATNRRVELKLQSQ